MDPSPNEPSHPESDVGGGDPSKDRASRSGEPRATDFRDSETGAPGGGESPDPYQAPSGEGSPDPYTKPGDAAQGAEARDVVDQARSIASGSGAADD